MNDLVVRSMRKAQYSSDSQIGHFALALPLYTHFTSPIRRYVDLIEHRLIKEVIKIYDEVIQKHNLDTDGKSMSDLMPEIKHYAGKQLFDLADEDFLQNEAVHINTRNGIADNISIKSDLTCGVLYMQKYLGEVKKGYINKIAREGITMTLFDENDLAHSNIINVLIPMSEIKNSKNYKMDDLGCSLEHHKSGKTLYTLGDTIETRITVCDPNTRTILATTDLQKELVTEEEQEF